jgi:hypothetical protein
MTTTDMVILFGANMSLPMLGALAWRYHLGKHGSIDVRNPELVMPFEA